MADCRAGPTSGQWSPTLIRSGRAGWTRKTSSGSGPVEQQVALAMAVAGFGSGGAPEAPVSEDPPAGRVPRHPGSPGWPGT